MANGQEKKDTILFIIWAQSVVAMLGSLFFSEVMHFIPCELCWYQRILMYPLVIMYGYAVVKKDMRFAFPGVLMSGIGMFVSTYHYILQKVPALREAGESCGIIPCTTEYINVFGFITIPFLALVAFIIIFFLHVTLLVQQRRRDQ
ncbi:disulfide oxidoreductase [Radiobacillus deserti]|uniref:Probable disulfide formation protein n=1 Tax=Radiobacillus deserti TaxID=2594883 RepID=A0A516KEE5_9BACI|nr:disulfide oxidoreductase [Radiobacillus deserti]QDP39737.1 disulfide bond formation protein B [Radiobacillus deserti]